VKLIITISNVNVVFHYIYQWCHQSPFSVLHSISCIWKSKIGSNKTNITLWPMHTDMVVHNTAKAILLSNAFAV